MSGSWVRYMEGRKLVCAISKWIKAHKQDGRLILRAGGTSGFTFYSDSDWAGLHGITGEVRSRAGFLASFNGMPMDWYIGLSNLMTKLLKNRIHMPKTFTISGFHAQTRTSKIYGSWDSRRFIGICPHTHTQGMGKSA